ncbi:hypothetical protein SAMN04488498_104360 [Mesorhizobium albiziae]|uniref:DUF7146 domain-containing protein n=1 Tax=Neomesorhizobium albiziae TaxID=335020 RepID=A0A1I3YF04_9HYPH|nr:DNA primase [Mesorhizobium albiziae]GLS29934.1 hypothetical protein GCM10007937_16420 [Mesorhizobium albiziae]SFK29776.1 hypothetical protein SAMN04488498_104360 [Mesorhizobium albiziae]
MNTAERIPQETIDKARAFDVFAVAARYGFAGRANPSGESVGPCPGCGGRDRFSVNSKKNIWRCRQGAGDAIGGDAIALVRHVENCGLRRAVEILTGNLADVAPKVDSTKAQAEENTFREKERRRAFDLWRAGIPFPDGGAVAVYLSRRSLDALPARMPGAHCREHADFPYWHHVDTGRTDAAGRPVKEWRIIHRGPAMLWPIVAADGHFLGLHATWVNPRGPKGKAEIFDPTTGEQLPAKKVRGSKKGGRIVLRDAIRSEPDAGVGEGVETVLSWSILRNFRGSLYSSVDLGNLAGRAARTVAHPSLKIIRRDDRQMPVRVPGPDPHPDEDPAKLFSPHPGIERLYLLGDGDSDPFATRAAMLRAQSRLTPTGLDCPIDWAPAPHDFNSLLMERIKADGME